MRNGRRLVVAAVVLVVSMTTASSNPRVAADPGTGPLGVPIRPADQRCVNGRPDEAGLTHPANDAYLDEHVVDWPTTTPADVGMDGMLLRSGLAEAARAPTLLSLLIVRHSRIVVEEYFHGAKAHQSRNLHSATKSVLAVLVGAAIAEGLLPGLQTPIADLVTEAAGTAVGAITLMQLLSMSGGLPTDLDEANLVQEVVGRQLVAAPGSHWEYSDASSELVALALERATPDGLCRYAHRVLGPLDITVDHWHVNPGGGVTGRAYAFLTPRELARFGQLVLQRGLWEGRTVIPAEWLETMLVPRYDIDGGAYRGRGECIGTEARRAYGLHWRIFEVSGRLAWTASGYGGQFVVVVPSLDLVMVLTHDTHHDLVMPVQRHLSPHAFLESFVLPGTESAEALDGGCAQDLVVARRDGSDALAVARHPADDLFAEWSPDGARIAFVSQRDLNAELYVVDRDGSHLERLTSDWAADFFPRWSPGGDRIAFVSDRDAASFDATYDNDVHVLDLATDVVHAVTPGLGDVFGFTWSPDGEQIAYVRSPDRSSLGVIWVADIGGGSSSVLHDGALGWPTWSPDGALVAVVTGRGADGEAPWRIGVLDVATGVVRELGPAADLPTWTGDGRAIVTSGDTDGGPVTVLIDPRSGARTTLAGVPAGRPSPDGGWIVYSDRPPVFGRSQ